MLKRFLCALLCLTLLATAGYAARDYEVELTDNEVLTARLESDGVTGEWDFEVSDPSIIDMLTCEYAPYAEDDYNGPGQFAISFKATSDKEGDANIIFKYVTPTGHVLDEVILSAYTQDESIFLGSNNGFSVDGNALSVKLDANATTGFEWNYNIDGDALLNLTKEDYIPEATDRVGAGGVYEAVFEPGKDAGHADVIFTYSRPWEDMIPARTITVGVDIGNDGGLELGNIEFRED